MAIEISSSDTETTEALRAIAKEDSDNITCLSLKPVEGKEIITLIIENFGEISTGTVVLIAALKSKIKYLRISKDGLEMSGSDKEKTLDNESE